MYTGISSLGATNNDIVPLATGGASTTGYENPFLYIATSQQKIDHPTWCFRRSVAGSRAELSYQTDADKTGNFYIFDFVRYLSDRSVSNPEIITLQLGMNDYYSTYWGNSQATINSALSLEIIYTQIRLALPTTPIGVLTYMPRYTNTGGFNAVDGLAIKNYCDVVNKFFVDKSDANFHAINTHALMNPDYIFDATEGALIDNSGNSTTQLALQTPFDGVHFSKNGYIEFSKVVGNFILNMMT
jgi:lysophospholipase L1-like esterase